MLKVCKPGVEKQLGKKINGLKSDHEMSFMAYIIKLVNVKANLSIFLKIVVM